LFAGFRQGLKIYWAKGIEKKIHLFGETINPYSSPILRAPILRAWGDNRLPGKACDSPSKSAGTSNPPAFS